MAEKSAVNGTVRIQAMAILPNSFQSTDCLGWSLQPIIRARKAPTQTTDPTLQWVVLMGIPALDAKSTVAAEPISMLNPVDGVIVVKSEPRVLITLLPQIIRPTEIPIPP